MASKTPVNDKVRKARARASLNKTPPLPDITPRNKREPEPPKQEKSEKKTLGKGSVADSVRSQRKGTEEQAYEMPTVPDESPEEILKRLRAGEKNFLDDLIGDALDFSDDEGEKEGEKSSTFPSLLNILIVFH